MTEWEHTLSPACWCDPVVAHVRGGQLIVLNERDAARLAELGVTTGVVVSPDVPAQRKGGEDHGR